MAGPSLNDVTRAVCPDSKPYKCLPYGVCYDHESFCSPISRTVEPCFPHSLLESETDLLAWCKDIVLGENTTLPHQSCLYACHHRFVGTKFMGVQTDQTVTVRPKIELTVITVLLVNWLVCGIIVSSLVFFCKIHSRSSQRVRLVKFLRNLTSRGGQTSGRSRHAVDNDQCTEHEEMIRLEPLTVQEVSHVDPEISSKALSKQSGKSHSEESETLQVVMEETDIDMRCRPSFGLQMREATDADELSEHDSLVYTDDTSSLGKPHKDDSLQEDVGVSLETDNSRREKEHVVLYE